MSKTPSEVPTDGASPSDDHHDESIFRTKSVETVLKQNEDDPGEETEKKGPKLRKVLSWVDLVGVGIGMVIGTGIFTLTGVQAKNHAGPAIVISFALAGVISLLAALCYSELASAVPTSGSAYTYAYTTMGEIFAWVIAWDLVLEFALGAAVVARGWSAYLGNMFGLPPSLFGETSTVNVGAIGIVLVLGVIAARGISEARWVTNALVAIKVAICLFIVILGAFFIKTKNWIPFIPPAQPVEGENSVWKEPLWQVVSGAHPTAFGIAGILTATAVVFFAYSGFEVVANMAEETKEPSRDMPRGILGTLVIATVLYMLVCLVVTGMQHYSKLDEGAPLAVAFNSVGQGWAGAIISIAAVCGLTSVTLIDIIAMGRIGFAMSRDGLLPDRVGRINPKTNTPMLITVVTVVVIALLGGFVKLATLADMVSIGTLFAFLIVCIAVVVLRRTKPDLKRPFRVPGSPVLPIIGAVLVVVMMTSLGVDTWLRFVVWLVVGLVVYFAYGRRHSRLGRGEEATTDAMG